NLPNGETFVAAQRFVFAWDRRDNALDASKGTLLSSSLEHVDAFPLGVDATTQAGQESHFLKFFNRFNFYVKLPFKARFASSSNLGTTVQLTATSSTYTDRLFFLGGQELRGWYVQSFIPQDDLDKLDESASRGCTPDDERRECYTLAKAPVRGGDLSVAQRFEVRIPVAGIVETVLFGDFGNLWREIGYPFRKGEFPIRVAVGTGLRLKTPVAPIAVDFGLNLTRRRAFEPDIGAFSFSLGLY
ncbi:MAG: BamA/TamA family outer membrane protein, partial [Myxococcales bacterium]|nr:BamA/TamA family outer membrane protein [Myxococcales bacterium]